MGSTLPEAPLRPTCVCASCCACFCSSSTRRHASLPCARSTVDERRSDTGQRPGKVPPQPAKCPHNRQSAPTTGKVPPQPARFLHNRPRRARSGRCAALGRQALAVRGRTRLAVSFAQSLNWRETEHAPGRASPAPAASRPRAPRAGPPPTAHAHTHTHLGVRRRQLLLHLVHVRLKLGHHPQRTHTHTHTHLGVRRRQLLLHLVHVRLKLGHHPERTHTHTHSPGRAPSPAPAASRPRAPQAGTPPTPGAPPAAAASPPRAAAPPAPPPAPPPLPAAPPRPLQGATRDTKRCGAGDARNGAAAASGPHVTAGLFAGLRTRGGRETSCQWWRTGRGGGAPGMACLTQRRSGCGAFGSGLHAACSFAPDACAAAAAAPLTAAPFIQRRT